MDKEVTKAIEILNEDLKEPGLSGASPTQQSSKVTDAPRNCGDGILQMKPGTSAKARKDLAAKVRRSRKKISEALTVLRHSLHRESKAKAKESIRNLMQIKSRCHTISRDSKSNRSKSRVFSEARKKSKAKPARKGKVNRVHKDEKPIMFVSRSRSGTSTSQRKSSIQSTESGSSQDQSSNQGAGRRN